MKPPTYFDLTARAVRAGALDRTREADMPLGEQLLTYGGCLAGVLFSAWVRSGGAGAPAITWGSLAVSAVIALAILPVVFERLSIKPGAPLLFRLGLAVQQGVFWNVLLDAAGRAVGG